MRFAVPLTSLHVLVLTIVLVPSSVWAQGSFVYTNDNAFGPNTVSAFSVSSNGTLTLLAGSPFATGGLGGNLGGLYASNRTAVVGNLLFASNPGSNDVSAFKINRITGALTAVAGSPFAMAGDGSLGIALSATPNRRFLMAADSGSNTITAFSIALSGSLSTIPGSPFATVAALDGIKVSPDGKFLAVAELTPGQVEMFSIASSGVLSSLGEFPGAEGATYAGIDIDCSTRFLYTGDLALNGSGLTTVDAFNIATDGALATVTGSPFVAPIGVGESNVVLLSPDGKILYASNQSANTITAFSVGPTGNLSVLPDSPFSMNSIENPSAMTTNEDGKLLFVGSYRDILSFGAAVSVFSVGSNGTLNEVGGSPFPTGQENALLSISAYPPKSCVQRLGIEIKPPALPPVPLNPLAEGKIPVAILSTLSFNAVTEIDPNSLTFGHTGNESSLVDCNSEGEDVNGDGLVDLVCHFNTEQTAFVFGDITAVLKGKTVTGRQIQGSERIRTVSH
jgi:6-phosphogluconolactonase